MKKLAILIPIILGGCSSIPDNALPCISALMQARVSNASELIMAAQQSPSCTSLGLDLMQKVIADVLARRSIK